MDADKVDADFFNLLAANTMICFGRRLRNIFQFSHES
jgi:hypothetical protein